MSCKALQLYQPGTLVKSWMSFMSVRLNFVSWRHTISAYIRISACAWRRTSALYIRVWAARYELLRVCFGGSGVLPNLHKLLPKSEYAYQHSSASEQLAAVLFVGPTWPEDRRRSMSRCACLLFSVRFQAKTQ